MKARILFIIIFLVLVTSYYAQKVNYNEILQETKNIQSAYVNENSMLLRINSRKLKLINLTTNQEKEIDLPRYHGKISQSKYDQYFFTDSSGELDNKGVLIDKDGNKKEVQLSTYHAKISEDGKHIITLRKTAHGDGYFQIIDTERMENQSTPKRSNNSFIADFIDSNRVLLLYQNVSFQFDEEAIDSIEKEYQKYKDIKNLSQKERKEINRNLRKEKRKYKKYIYTTKYMIYNIETENIEHEEELIIDNNKYHYHDEINCLAISDDGQKGLISSYQVKTEYINNKLLELDFNNYSVSDISNIVAINNNDGIRNVSYLTENNSFVILSNNQSDIKYSYFKNNRLFSIENKAARIRTLQRSEITIEKDKIIIIDPENNIFIWEYKKRTIKKLINKYPVYLFNGKVKIEEAQK